MSKKIKTASAVNSINTAPTFNNSLNATANYSENATPVILDSSVQITDSELAALGHYAGASITLKRQGVANAQDVFSGLGNLVLSGTDVRLSGVFIGEFTQANGVLSITFNNNATQARINEAVSSLAYSNNSDMPPALVQIDWTFNDGNTGAQGTGVPDFDPLYVKVTTSNRIVYLLGRLHREEGKISSR